MDVNLQNSNILTQNKNFIIRNFEKNDIDSEFISWFKNKKILSFLGTKIKIILKKN